MPKLIISEKTNIKELITLLCSQRGITQAKLAEEYSKVAKKMTKSDLYKRLSGNTLRVTEFFTLLEVLKYDFELRDEE